ncbi:hypothetical protein MnTg04_01436 [bacterium MnTg04]|nr:hypothetical protein MnTg04_01436 [bacterium MnTg04]
MVPHRVRVVIERIGARIIVIHRVGLINDDLLRFVIRNVNHFRVDRRDLDCAVFVADDLVFICLQIASEYCAVTKSLDCLDDFRFLVDYGFTKLPGPFQVAVQQVDDLGIVEQGNDRFVPVLIGLQRGIIFQLIQKAGSLHYLQWIGGGR